MNGIALLIKRSSIHLVIYKQDCNVNLSVKLVLNLSYMYVRRKIGRCKCTKFDTRKKV